MGGPRRVSPTISPWSAHLSPERESQRKRECSALSSYSQTPPIHTDHVPRHPSQLYEAVGYLFVFILLWFIYWKTDKMKKPGYLFGLFFALLWSVRFFVEFFKEKQVEGGENWMFGLNTGQVLSIPLILIGLYFMFRKTNETKKVDAKK